MSLTKQDLLNQSQLMQDDLSCILDGIENEILDNACEMIVERINILINKLEEKKRK